MFTSKERVRTAISHRQPDRVAIDFLAREEVVGKLYNKLNLKNFKSLQDKLGLDLIGVGPVIKKSADPLAYADPTVEVTKDKVYLDIWGVGFKFNQTEAGSYMDLCFSPLKKISEISELEKYSWPTADLWDYSNIASDAEASKNYWVWAHSRGIFEISWFMRGFEEFMMDMIQDPDMANAIMDHVQKYLMERTERILKEGKGLIDMMEYNDDVGGQNGLLLSPNLWRTFVKPRMADFIKMCKKYNVKIRYHSCGGVRPIINDLIEIGVDVLNPVQTLAVGMEPEGLKKDFGDRITFNGGIDTQELLVNHTADEVRNEVKRLIDIFNKNGGYILTPSHTFQGDVPVENILAVYEAALGREIR